MRFWWAANDFNEEIMCLLHLPGKIVLAGSKSRGRLLLTGEAHFHRCSKLNLAFDTCWGIFESFTAS